MYKRRFKPKKSKKKPRQLSILNQISCAFFKFCEMQIFFDTTCPAEFIYSTFFEIFQNNNVKFVDLIFYVDDEKV